MEKKLSHNSSAGAQMQGKQPVKISHEDQVYATDTGKLP
jgi:hypothetical protein